MQPQPNEVIRIRYDSLENLFAMGIVERPASGAADHRPVSGITRTAIRARSLTALAGVALPQATPALTRVESAAGLDVANSNFGRMNRPVDMAHRAITQTSRQGIILFPSDVPRGVLRSNSRALCNRPGRSFGPSAFG